MVFCFYFCDDLFLRRFGIVAEIRPKSTNTEMIFVCRDRESVSHCVCVCVCVCVCPSTCINIYYIILYICIIFGYRKRETERQRERDSVSVVCVSVVLPTMTTDVLVGPWKPDRFVSCSVVRLQIQKVDRRQNEPVNVLVEYSS
jgi:hypothetical protein